MEVHLSVKMANSRQRLLITWSFVTVTTERSVANVFFVFAMSFAFIICVKVNECKHAGLEHIHMNIFT